MRERNPHKTCYSPTCTCHTSNLPFSFYHNGMPSYCMGEMLQISSNTVNIVVSEQYLIYIISFACCITESFRFGQQDASAMVKHQLSRSHHNGCQAIYVEFRVSM